MHHYKHYKLNSKNAKNILFISQIILPKLSSRISIQEFPVVRSFGRNLVRRKIGVFFSLYFIAFFLIAFFLIASYFDKVYQFELLKSKDPWTTFVEHEFYDFFDS